MSTLRQSPGQVPDKVSDLSQTQIMKVRDTNHVMNLFRTLSLTFSMHCNGLNSIRATQTGLSWTCHGLCCNILTCRDGLCPRLLWFVKVGVMEFGLMQTYEISCTCKKKVK